MINITDFPVTTEPLATDVVYLVRPSDTVAPDKKITVSDLVNNGETPITWLDPYIAGTYPDKTMTKVKNWTMIANKETADVPNPQQIGFPYRIYDCSGTYDEIKVLGKQLTYGIRISKSNSYWMETYGIRVDAGNHYEIILVKDPLGTKEVTYLQGFTASDSNDKMFDIKPILVQSGEIYDLIVQETVEDGVVSTTDIEYNYSQVNAITIPPEGAVYQSLEASDKLYINYVDSNTIDQGMFFLGLEAGHIIKLDNIEWYVQDVELFSTYAIVSVAPNTSYSLPGNYIFSFVNPQDAYLSYDIEVDHWVGNPDAKGLFLLNGSWEDVAVSDDAFGISLMLQDAVISEDWDLVAYSPTPANDGEEETTHLVNYIKSVNKEITLEFDGEGGDKGVKLIGGQLSVGDRYHGNETVLGGGDSYPIPRAFHCSESFTTGTVIDMADDVSELLQDDAGGITGLFGGTAVGDYFLMGSETKFWGTKMKYETLGTVEPENVQNEYLKTAAPEWYPVYIMATDANAPYESSAHHISSFESEQIRVGFNPLDGTDPYWEKVTLTINGEDITAYWSRVRITTAITSDPELRQVKLHTSRFEVNSDGVTEYFGASRPPRTVQSGITATVPNGLNDPADGTVAYGTNYSAKYKDNKFEENREDGFGLMQSIAEGTDTSIPMLLTVSYYVNGTATGDIYLKAESYQVADGFVYDGTAPSTIYPVIDTIATSQNKVRRSVKMLIPQEQLLPTGEAVVISIIRDARDALDTLAETIVITNVTLTAYFWR